MNTAPGHIAKSGKPLDLIAFGHNSYTMEDGGLLAFLVRDAGGRVDVIVVPEQYAKQGDLPGYESWQHGFRLVRAKNRFGWIAHYKVLEEKPGEAVIPMTGGHVLRVVQ